MMKKFEGTWNIQPFNQATLDDNFGFERKPRHWLSAPGNVLKGLRAGDTYSKEISKSNCSWRKDATV